MNLNLILAAVWLALAVLLFTVDALEPGAARAQLAGGLPLFWVAMALCVYNVLRGLAVRWRGSRVEAPRPRRRTEHPRGEPGERNPDFIFDDPPDDGGRAGAR